MYLFVSSEDVGDGDVDDASLAERRGEAATSPWLREHRVTRVEQLSFNVEGLVWDRISYEVDADGAMQRIDED